MNFGPKQVGRCLCCQDDCYEVLEVWTDGSLEGHPRRLGKQLECGTQVEFLMSNGTETDITFCITCANELTIEHYQDIWEACIDRDRLDMLLTGARLNDVKMATLKSQAIFPMDILLFRKIHPETDRLYVDRRRNNG